MAYFVEPGHIAMVMLTPEQYMRMYQARSPSMWPVYFGARGFLQTVQNIAMVGMQQKDIEAIQDHIPALLTTGFSAASAAKKGGPTGDVSNLRAEISTITRGLLTNWKAGIAKGVGGAYSTAMDRFIASGQLLYAYKVLMYHTAITPRMRRYWNSVYTPMVPDGSMAYVLFKRGYIDLDKFKTYASYDGWDAEHAEMLLDAMELLPSAREAFYLWVKGQITQAQRDKLYQAAGYDARWHGPMTENWYYVPTIYDLTRMADYIELDQIWATAQMRKRGVRDSDIAKIWEMLQLRPLREEMRALTLKWTWRMKYGRATTDDLEDAFIELGIRRKERELLIEKAQLDYEDELVDEWVEILTWRFRTALITEEQFLQGLIDLGINEEKSNLIVEVEKAKGYYGYY